MKSLPDRGRKILVLKYSDGRSSRDIARTTGMQVGAIDMMLSRLRRALQDCMSRKLSTVRHG
jgi:DNA-directed RNA polymerase specialized sigma24 family protein